MNTSPRYLGKYELQERLGQGGMGEVWKALDPQLGRYVAVKILHQDLQQDPDFLRRFEREARVIASLRHPNIVRVHDYQIVRHPDTQNSVAYMVMGYIQGQTLAEYIRNTSRAGKFPPSTDILHLFTSIGLAIDYAHQHRIIHRDIKPANILLDQNTPSHFHIGTPILSDFGIVKLLDIAGMTTNGAWVGTPLYISPEQAQGHPGDTYSDLYSLGVVLYEVCTGRLPFQGPLTAVLMQHMMATPTLPSVLNPTIPHALDAVIMRSLAKDPIARYPSASALTVALAEAFKLSVPTILNQLSTAESIDSQPTYVKAPPIPYSASIVPPTMVATTPAYGFAGTSPSEQQEVHTPTTPSFNSSAKASIQPRDKKRVKKASFAIAGLLLILLAGSGLWSWLALSQNKPPLATNTIVGHAFFISTGQINPTSSQGICDQLEIDLTNVAPPATDKKYYAWLLNDSDQKQFTSLLLGTPLVNNGKIHFLYAGNAQHTNLIGTMSRLLVTEEDAQTTPAQPSQNRQTWRYYSELPQTLSSVRKEEKGISHLRGLLYEHYDGENPGGSDTYAFTSIQEILTLATSAKDAWGSGDAQTIHTQLIRILDHLDGAAYVQRDVPHGTPLLVDASIVQTPLITYEAVGATSSLQTMDDELVGLLHVSDLASDKRALVVQADASLTQNVFIWLQGVRKDARILVTLSDRQLMQVSTQGLLNDMATQSYYSLDGRIDPSMGQRQEGISWIHNTVARLATFDIKLYKM